MYSVRGNTAKAVTLKGNLTNVGSKTLPVGCSGIGYDRKKGKFVLSSGSNLVATDNNLKITKRFSKVGTWKYSQDVGTYNGIAYVCVSVDKSSDNRIGMYNTKSGKYLGSYKLGWSGIEIEDCEVDDSGRLLILVNDRHSTTDYIMRTKSSLAMTPGGSVK